MSDEVDGTNTEEPVEEPAADDSATDTGEATTEEIPSIWSVIGSFVLGVIGLGFVILMVWGIGGDGCDVEGITLVCVSYGGATRVTTEVNLLIMAVVALVSLGAILRAVLSARPAFDKMRRDRELAVAEGRPGRSTGRKVLIWWGIITAVLIVIGIIASLVEG